MVYELSHLGFIKISGKDAKKFLQGQLTCDVELVTASNTCLGAHCNPQGRIISLFYLFLLDESYYLLMPKTLIPLAMAALKKYAVFFKTELSDASTEMLAIGCQDLLAENIGHLMLISIPTDNSRFMLVGESSAIKSTLNQLPTQRGPIENWKLLDIKNGIPTIYPETSGKFLPHDINLAKLQAISFDKGCYTGQEIIARMQYRGKSKNHMYQAHVICDTPPQPGADIYSLVKEEIKPSGILVAAGYEGYNNYYVLIITNELNDNNGLLFLNHDKNTVLTIQPEK